MLPHPYLAPMETKADSSCFNFSQLDNIHTVNWENAIDSISGVYEPLHHPRLYGSAALSQLEILNVNTAAMFSLPMLYFKNSGSVSGYPTMLVNRSSGKEVVFSMYGEDLKINPVLHRAELCAPTSSSMATVFDICDSVALLKASAVGKTLVDGACLSLCYADNYTTVTTSVTVENMGLLKSTYQAASDGFIHVPRYCLKFYPVFSFIDKSPLLEWYGTVELE